MSESEFRGFPPSSSFPPINGDGGSGMTQQESDRTPVDWAFAGANQGYQPNHHASSLELEEHFNSNVENNFDRSFEWLSNDYWPNHVFQFEAYPIEGVMANGTDHPRFPSYQIPLLSLESSAGTQLPQRRLTGALSSTVYPTDINILSLNERARIESEDHRQHSPTPSLGEMEQRSSPPEEQTAAPHNAAEASSSGNRRPGSSSSRRRGDDSPNPSQSARPFLIPLTVLYPFLTSLKPLESDERPFGCEKCPARFARKRDVDRHKRSVHGGPNSTPYHCIGCNERFVRSDARGRHFKASPSCYEMHKAAEETKRLARLAGLPSL
ncbi:hypothetical protein FRB91_010418 [Serendipita sp. 411]|nr:hypothetical protein FRB91_010418 [Serendipita sp. 411]